MLGAGGNICLQVRAHSCVCLHDERNNMFVVEAQLIQAASDFSRISITIGSIFSR